MTADTQYSAFISYSHSDREWARWLQSALESYRIPRIVRRDRGIAKRLQPVFRDESEMGAASNLGEAVERALTDSSKLIVICSRASQKSLWVQAEVAFFLKLGRRDRIILVLVEGTPEESFPASLAAAPLAEDGVTTPLHANLPLAADARAQPGRSLRARRNRVRLSVVAAILDLQPDELIRRHQQRQIRTLTAAAGILLTVTTLMAVLAIVAVTQRNRAERQEREAEIRLADSKVQQGGALILANRWTDGFAAFDEARSVLEALNLSSMPLGLKMIEAEQRSLIPYPYLRLPDATVVGLETSFDGTRLAVATNRGIRVFDLTNDEQLLSIEVEHEFLDRFALSPDGSTLAVSSGREIRLLSAEDGEVFGTPWTAAGNIEAIEISPRDPVVLIAQSNGQVSAWDLESNELLVLVERDSAVTTMDMSQDGGRLIVSWEDGTTEVCQLSRRGCDSRVSIEAGRISTASLSSDGGVAVTGDGQFLRFWDADTGKFRSESPMRSVNVDFVGDLVFSSDAEGDITAFDIETGTNTGYFPSPPTLVTTHAAFSRERISLLSSYEGGVLYWQLTFLASPGAGQSFSLEDGRFLEALAVSPEGELIALGDDIGRVQLLDACNLRLLETIDAHSGVVEDTAFSPDGESLLTVGADERAIRWDLTTGEVRQRYDVSAGKLAQVAFSNDGSLIAIGNETGNVSILVSDSGETVTSFSVGARVSSLAYSGDDSRLAIGTERGNFLLWSAKNGRLRMVGSIDTEGYLRVTPVGMNQALVVGGSAGLWDLEPGQRLLSYGSRVTDAWDAGLLGQDLVYAGGAEKVGIFDRATAAEVANLTLFTPMLLDGTATADGELFVAAGFADVQSFRWRHAIRRAELRQLLTASDVQASISDNRIENLAEWYFLHGFNSVALDYLEHPDFVAQSISDLSIAKILIANDQPDKAMVHLASALEKGEISKTYAAVLRRSLSTR